MCTECSCSTETSTDSASGRSAVLDETGQVSEYTVIGMTCGHCVRSVTEELQQIPGVRDVAVDLTTGAVTVTADQPVADEAVVTAVREAGYQIA